MARTRIAGGFLFRTLPFLRWEKLPHPQQAKACNKKLGFSAELPEFQYYGNASLLSEVWINLLDNAAKFSPEEGDISVLLRTEESYVIISIVDHGPGMDLKTQAHIFDQFYQGDPSHASEGNGLGLAMVQKIITLHHGEIIPDSAPGRGSCFTVRLPL